VVGLWGKLVHEEPSSWAIKVQLVGLAKYLHMVCAAVNCIATGMYALLLTT